MLCLGIIDSWSTFAQVVVINDGSASAVFAAAQRGWVQTLGAPVRIFHDAAAAFRGVEWGQLWSQLGTMVCCSAAEAPWQHGAIEIFWRVFRRALRVTWMTYADHPKATPEDAIRHTVNARNDLGRLSIGVSPSMLVLNRMPKRLLGDDLGEDIDSKLVSDPSFAEQRARRAKAEQAWIQAKTW